MNKDTYTVTGFVRFADGHPAAAVQVGAFDRDLRSEQPLGRAETARDGSYRIAYSDGRFRQRERGTADLVVKAFDAGGELLASSPIAFNAPAAAVVDLVIESSRCAPPSLFRKLGAALEPLLGITTLDELEQDDRHDDLAFLAPETGFGKPVLARYLLAHRLAAHGIEPRFWFAVLSEAVFTYDGQRSLAAQLRAVTPAVLALQEASVRRLVAQSLARNEIDAAPTEERCIERWIEAFLRLAAQAALHDGKERTFLGHALEHAGIREPRQQEKVARLYQRAGALTPELVKELEAEGSFSSSQLAEVVTAYRLADLTGGDFSVVKVLKEELEVRRPEQLRQLARRSQAQWVELIERKHQAGELALPLALPGTEAAQPPTARLYGQLLDQKVRAAFPTSAFAGGLARALGNGGAHGVPRPEALLGFLDRHEDFELARTPVDEYLDQSVHPELRELARDPAFRREVKAVQRVFKLAPSFAATDAILADGVHSAQRLYRMGESEVVRRYADRAELSADEARQLWRRAAETHAAAVTIVGDLKGLDPEGLPAALRGAAAAAIAPGAADAAALASFPNWEALFGGGDLCDCAQCRSVLGPAAYFADLLMFLRDRKARNPASSVKDLLFQRRPDLGNLELTCDNALVTLPYVDVVCEVLERAIVGEAGDVALPGLTAMPADPTTAHAAVAAALEAAGLPVGAELSLVQVDPADPDRYVVHGSDATYLLQKQPPALPFFAKLAPNTKASSQELRAYPAYVNAAAYQTLRQARFPFGLPFDLFAAEVRAGFDKCALARWDLMRTLRGSAAPAAPGAGEIAAEYFGISVDPGAAFDERRLILEAAATAAAQQVVWGEAGNPGWLVTVANAKTFLAKTGLEYEQLLALLELGFINPAPAALTIEHLDASCDTAQQVVHGLEAIALDRIHRFLRLWRKLDGWQLWELDLVVRHPRLGAGALDEAFLIRLHALDRLRRRLGPSTSVEQLAALLGDLNTTTHFTHAHEKRGDSLYHSLFLNKRLVQPLDPAFEVAAVSVVGPAVETLAAHRTVILAALGLREADLERLLELPRPSTGLPYLDGTLTLANLSFLWRHSWLAKATHRKLGDWVTLLALGAQDRPDFGDPQAALAFVEQLDHLEASGLSADELSWILAANPAAKAAVPEASVARALTGLRNELASIHKLYDPAAQELLHPPTELEGLSDLLSSLLQRLHRDEAGARFFLDVLRDEVALASEVSGLPGGFDFPESIKAVIPIRCDRSHPPAVVLRFTGLMTAAQRATLLGDAALAAVTALAGYREAIEDLYLRPRLACKFLDPVFTAPLAGLPAAVDLKALTDPALGSRVAYDPEERALRVTGLLEPAQRAALDALSADVAYRAAVASLFDQPRLGTFPASALWMTDAELAWPLRDRADPAADHLKDNLATAITKALRHLAATDAEGAVLRLLSAELGLGEALTRSLLTDHAILPGTLMAHLIGPFAATSGVVDRATLPLTFDGFAWASRVAALWKRWKLTLPEWKRLTALQAPGQLLAVADLPLHAGDPAASLERFVRTSRLLAFKESLPETGTTLLEVLAQLAAGGYATPAAFAAEVERLNEAWGATDVEALVAALDLTYPGGYLLVESWERLRRALAFCGSLGASVTTARTFAAATMTEVHVGTLKGLLRAKLGSEAWLTLSAEIQDALRERKRDALAAYLLTRPRPVDAPSGTWDHPNDLYAYYLLDVEMCACQLTSRLVQASGSVQLFVQRCFMGLEPEVEVKADGDGGDTAWRWWTWMRKYRVWEANRKVFLWPENWIEPELKVDRSPFFKDLENELLQNEVNQPNVEKAFASYLEKLDGVAQLEIAGFHHQDDGDETILHVFGRTKGTEPHLYYYRRFDYRQWTPWEKVELDIQGDYLVPAVVGQRLFLLWPIFTELPDEAGNSTVSTPTAGQPTVALQRPSKRLRLQLAVSDYRQGKWTAKRVSTDFDESYPYHVDIVRQRYRFYAVDRSNLDGRFGLRYDGSSIDRDDQDVAWMSGSFEISGCKGVPERASVPGSFRLAYRPEREAVGPATSFLKWTELDSRDDSPQDDLTLESAWASSSAGVQLTEVLQRTPGRFRLSPPWQLSFFDRLLYTGSIPGPIGALLGERATPLGSWLPFFYDDQQRTFLVLPVATVHAAASIGGKALFSETSHLYYPELKRSVREALARFEGWLHTWIDPLDFTTIPPAQRAQAESLVAAAFPEEAPPFTEDQLRELLVRYFLRLVRYYYGFVMLLFFQFRQFHFKNFYHPFVCDFARLVNDPLQGIPGLMKRETQLRQTPFRFGQQYQPTAWVLDPVTEREFPQEVVDFSPDGAYASYNWELFFHAPLLIANSLSQNQRFEEARDWYHFIWNPIGVESATAGGSPMSKFWITKPFFETSEPQYVQQRIENLLRMLAGDPTVPGYSPEARDALEGQVRDWRVHPFEPHRIASYRTVAYQKTVFMKYLDNLIAWGDHLFGQDSMESINEATQLYVLAAELLGPRPRRVPPAVKPPLETWNELERVIDGFGNALVEIENLIPPQPGSGGAGTSTPPLPMLYFCIPHNDKMLGYWDTVADRLYKIRHCMNLEGVVRQLALFEPPIDPAALVKAVAAGADVGAALADLAAPLPLYRFSVLLQSANEVCADVRALGAALLAALEKRDAEALARLRQSHEHRVLEAVKALREQQVEEARLQLAGLQKSKELVTLRRDFYRDIEKISSGEQLQQQKLESALVAQQIAQVINIAASIAHIVPSFDLGVSGFGGTPKASVMFGGPNVGSMLQAVAGGFTVWANAENYSANKAAIDAGHERRWEDWKLQERLASKELEQLDRQLATAELRIAIAERELANHVLQLENSRAMDAFMRSKYTNQELYQWQTGQLSGVYFQSYKLAQDLARRAERCYRFELGLADSSLISGGYWDSLKKGLLAGEQLQYDLRRLETTYREQNRRELELTKHVSLALLDPLALVQLRETGRCFFRVPEELFDLDYPGHYFRRLRSVSLTLPCVVGPYATVSATLRLLKSSVRVRTRTGGGYARATEDSGLPAEDPRFVESPIPVKAIATSGAQNDSGLFELNFRDERYLPFEGGGAISEWSLELFHDAGNADLGRALRQFDYDSIPDAVLHLKYTAREDAGPFKNSAVAHLRGHFAQQAPASSLLMLNLRRDLASQWSRFQKPNNPATGNVFELDVSSELFPLRDAGKTLKITSITILARCTDAGAYEVTLTPPLPEPPPDGVNTLSLTRNATYGNLHVRQQDVSAHDLQIVPRQASVPWKLRFTRPGGGDLQVDPVTQAVEVEDVIVVLAYAWL